MKVIHDNPDDLIPSTLALAIAWNLPVECQVEDCTNPTAAIMCIPDCESQTESAINISICEYHYQKGVREGRLNEKFIL
jgi:hypothetical protein